jgi:hypothetical protein
MTPLMDSARLRSSCCLSVVGATKELVPWDSDANDISRCSRWLPTSRLGGSFGPASRSDIGPLIGVITKTVRLKVYKTRLWVYKTHPWVYRTDNVSCTFWVCRTHCPCGRLAKYKTAEPVQF